jgi:hypothetical protein
MKMTKTKTLIVTETVRYEFEVSASMPEDETTLKRFFGKQPDPWAGADFAAVTECDFVVQASGRVPSARPLVQMSSEG